MKLISIVLLILSSCAPKLLAAEFGLSDMRELADQVGGRYERGTARINGLDHTIGGLFGITSEKIVIAEIRKLTLNKKTVTEEWSPYGRVIVIADIYSPMCPTCQKPTQKNRASIIRSTYAISFIRTPMGLMAIGSKVGALVGHRHHDVAYTGKWLSELATSSSLTGFSEFKFHNSSSRQLIGRFKGSEVDASLLVTRSMESQGYVRAYSSMENGSAVSHWHKGTTFSRVLISKPNQGQVIWQAYEVTGP